MSVLLDVRDVSIRYPGVGSLFGGARQRQAVTDVSLSIEPGRTFGLVGESGSGKSTIGRAILRLVDTAEGQITYDGKDLADFGRRTPRSYRRAVQVVFQNPATALNPSWTVGRILREPLRMHRGVRDRAELSRSVDALLDQVGLSSYLGDRYPWELSGGQCQRVAIARAIAAQPKLIVCDEPVSALDVSTQSQVINLLEDLQAELGIAYLFIAHDLAVVRHISHDVGVLYAGRLMECGPAEQVYAEPAHPYTQTLLNAIPIPDPAAQRERRTLRRELRVRRDQSEVGSTQAGATGCPFQNRCPLVMDICRTEMPPLRATANGRQVACHAYE